LHQGAIVGCFAIVSCFSGQIIKLWGSRPCIFNGITLALLGSFSFVIISLFFPQSPYLTTISMIIFAIGFAICYPVIFASSLEIFPEIKGTASSAIMGMRAFVCASLVGLAGYLYNGQPIRISVLLSSTSVLCGFLILYLLGHTKLFAKVQIVQSLV